MSANYAVLLKALQEIIDMGTKCIYSHDPVFQEGSHAAFVECAEIAAAALAKTEKAA